MTYRSLFLSLLVSIFCCVSVPALFGMGMPNMNMEDFERELAEANRAIEEYVASLPPAEQAEFNKQVEEFSRMFENMSEDEFEQFLGEMFADEPMMMEPNPFDNIQTAPQEVVPEVVLSADDKKKVETALAVLDDIIKQSNVFTVIVNSSSDLPGRIDQWGKKGEIPHWQTGADWIALKTEIEAFIQKLYKAEEQDLTTKKYKYLFELIADEALYNNLIQLRTELKNIIPTIDIPEFSIKKLSTESKKAIKTVLGKYTESFYLLDIPKALTTLFEKYAPEEEKIKAAEEAATQRAKDAARMTRTPAAKTEAGSEDYGYGDYGYGGYDNYYSPYGDYGYGNDYGYSPNYGSYGGDYGGYGSGGGRSGGGSGSGSGSSGGSSGGGTSDKEKEEKEKKDKDKKKKETRTPNYEIDTLLKDIKKDLEEIKSTMTEIEEENIKPTKLADLVTHITQDEKIDEIIAGYVLPRVVDKKLSNIEAALKKLSDKAVRLNAEDLLHYQKEVDKLFADYKKELDTLSEAISSFEKKTEEEKEAAKRSPKKALAEGEKEIIDIETLSPVKQWAYFGGSALPLSTNDEEKKLTDTITPVSLFDIGKKINKLRTDVKQFKERKAEAPKMQKQSAFDVIPAIPAAPDIE